MGSLVIFHALPNGLDHPRVGITVTKKSGKAVTRNRWKRLVKEVFRRNRYLFPPVDMVVTVKRGVKLPTYQELEKDMLRMVKRI